MDVDFFERDDIFIFSDTANEFCLNRAVLRYWRITLKQRSQNQRSSVRCPWVAPASGGTCISKSFFTFRILKALETHPIQVHIPSFLVAISVSMTRWALKHSFKAKFEGRTTLKFRFLLWNHSSFSRRLYGSSEMTKTYVRFHSSESKRQNR